MQKLQTVNAETLLYEPLEKPSFVVDSLIPTGLSLFCGSQKIGKSWLMLKLCLCVSQGLPLWDMPTMEGDVLYLCLEDTFCRIQDRLFRLTNEASRRLHFAVASCKLSDGLIVQLEDYAISIIETLMNLEEDRDIEYSSMVYSIYSQFKNFDIENGHKILDAQYSMTKSLMTKLKNLNTNIKRYIKRLVQDNMKNDLNQILDSLLSDYQLKIVDRAFYNLTTKDHPLKYRNSIISQIQRIQDDQATSETIIGNIMLSKDLTYQEAMDLFYKQTSYIIDAFESILDLINEINRKNEKFVASATNRIMFLMNVKEDIGGKINDIIKEGQECPEVFDQVATISINKYLDQNSLYLPRQIKKVKNTDLILDTQLDEQTRLMAIEKLKQNEKYTKTAIEKNVLQCLDQQETILGSNYYDQNKDLSLFILTWLYGYSQNARYKIEPQENIIKKDHYQFREFIIRRLEDE